MKAAVYHGNGAPVAIEDVRVKEPGTGEMNYRNLFKHIRAKGYAGVFGMEHGNSLPGKEGEQALIDAYVAADSFQL